MGESKTYEMLWNCAYCGSQKLLGLTHRHCPNCGAPQDPTRRYFPSDEEKVAVEDHEYVGADVICPACQTANSRKSKHCRGCSGPLGEGREVSVVPDQLVSQPAPVHGHAPGFSPPAPPAPQRSAAPPKKSRASLAIAFGCGFMIVLLILVIVVFYALNNALQTDGKVVVTQHRWTHEIPIESLEETTKTSDCSSMPRDARVIQRTREAQKCTTKRVDQGDGTYRQERDCKPGKERCKYVIQEWKRSHSVKKEGTSINDQLAWPDVQLSRTGNCVGCERKGTSKAEYVVVFVHKETKQTYECTFSKEDKWRGFAPGSEWSGKIGGLAKDLDCDTLSK